MHAEQQLAAFIGASFRSVWALELLCHLRRHSDERRSPAELVAALRASDLVVRRSLGELVAAGLVSVDGSGNAQYAPATPKLDRMVAAAEERYGKSPDAVRRIIVKAANADLAAFADAFRLGGDK